MATPWAELRSSGSETNPSVGEDILHLDGSFLDQEVRAMFQVAWTTKVCSDIILCAGGTEIKAHKLLLAAHSLYFKQKLGESRVILDIEPDILRLVLTFIYDGGLDVPKGKIHQVREAANMLQIPVLQSQCLSSVLAQQDATDDNCLVMWLVGRKVKNEQLSSTGLEFALKNLSSVQYDAHFLKLTLEYIQEYIFHENLEVPSPDVKLSAVVRWVLHDPKARLQHLAAIMDNLPLAKMQIWLLQDTMHNPLMKSNKEVHTRLERAIKEQNVCAGKRGRLQQAEGTVLRQPTQSESQGEFGLVSFAHQLPQGDGWQEPSDEVVLCRVGVVIKAETVGKIKATYIPDCTKSITSGKTLYAGGLGNDFSELWQFNLDNKSSTNATDSLVSRFKTGRVGHAMCIKDNLVYILGGCTGETSCTASVEVFDPEKRSCTEIGSLKHFNIINSDGDLLNTTSIADDNGDNLIICGPFLGDDNGKPLKYQHTIQIFSTSRRAVTSSMTLPTTTNCDVYSLLPVNNHTYIILAHDYTAVVKKEHIELNQPQKCSFPDKYVVPNGWCGIALSPNREHVLLLGGEPKQSSPDHFLYKACMQDILANTGSGWEKMQGHWPLGKCRIFLSNTMDVVKL